MVADVAVHLSVFGVEIESTQNLQRSSHQSARTGRHLIRKPIDGGDPGGGAGGAGQALRPYRGRASVIGLGYIGMIQPQQGPDEF